MPILAKETSLYPPSLLDDVLLPSSQNCWWAIYTKSRQEKALARFLLSREIPFYLPTVDRTSLIRGRKVRSSNPLFAGYMFLYGSQEERTQCFQSNRISSILPVHDQQQLSNDLKDICRLTESEFALTVESRLEPGQRVRVHSGVFQGLEGVIVTRRGKTRLAINVDFLQQGASVEIDDFLFEPIS